MKKRLFGTSLVAKMLLLLLIFSPVEAVLAQVVSIKQMEISDAGEEQKNKKFSITPKLSVSSRTDSNYYKTENDETRVYTQRVSPGIRLGYATGKSSISLDYSLDAYLYGGGDVDNFIGHTLDFEAATRPWQKLTLGVDDSFYRTREQEKSGKLADNTDTGTYYINRFTPWLNYTLNDRLSAGLKYQNTLTSYSQESSEDSVEHRGIMELVYSFSPTASLNLSWQRWKRDYDISDFDYNSDMAELALKKQGKYISLEAAGGYHTRKFENPSMDDANTFTYRLGIGGRTSEDNRTTALLSLEQDFNASGVPDNFFKATRIGLNANHKINERMDTGVDGYYKMTDYQNYKAVTAEGDMAEREDDIYGISASLGYQIREWLKFRMTGGYENRNSNLAGYDYDNTYFMIGLDSAFDL